MGLLDAFKQYARDAMPGGLLNTEWTPDNVRTLAEVASMTPTPIGDAASAGLTLADLVKGDYGSAAMNGVGLLPFLPAMGGAIKKLNSKEVDQLLKYGQEADDSLYHIAPLQSIKKIMTEGLQPKPLGRPSTFESPIYRQHGIGKAFLTERDGVPYWMERIENSLFHSYDNPPPVRVVKIPKKDIKSQLFHDEIGTADAKHPAWYVTETIPPK